MTRLAEIQGHIASMEELLDIVGAMRSLAGMRVQEAQRALPGIRRYAESMADAIGAALLLIPSPVETTAAGGRRALILCAAEHGFVGGFNERLVEAAEATLGKRDLLFALGSRGGALALERGWRPAWARPMATRLAGAPETVDHLTTELYTRIARGEIGRVEVMFGRYRQGSPSTIEHHLLLPLDAASLAVKQARQAPLHNLDPQALLEKLMAEYVFALLTEAAVESISSENAARFAAMESASDNVTKKLSELRQSAREARQSEITAELLDLITGTEAQATI
jgi:F-type H+-transporting ATPase subunit gamma